MCVTTFPQLHGIQFKKKITNNTPHDITATITYSQRIARPAHNDTRTHKQIIFVRDTYRITERIKPMNCTTFTIDGHPFSPYPIRIESIHILDHETGNKAHLNKRTVPKNALQYTVTIDEDSQISVAS